MLAWLVGCDHVIELGDEARLFSVAFGAAAAAAVTLWFFYLALEPFGRRRFPQALVSWSRLLNGRLADSLVARDLLIGIGGGVAGCLILDAAYALPALWGGRARVVTSLQAIGPFHRTLGNAFVLQVDSIETAIGMIFALVFLQQLVKRTAIAVAAWFAIFLLASLTLPALAPYLALMLVLLLRFGLLTVTATNLVAGTLRQTSLTLDPTAWFFGRSTAVLSVIAAAVLVLAFLTTRAMPTPVSASRGAAE